MLELLAGPFDLLDLDGNPVYSESQFSNFYYDDDIGLIYSKIVSSGSSYNQIVVCQLDGTACVRSNGVSGRLIVDMQLDRKNEYLITQGSSEGKFSIFDKWAGTRREVVVESMSNSVNRVDVRLNDRYLSATSGVNAKVKWRPLAANVNEADEATLTNAGTGTNRPTWSRTREYDVMALAYIDGTILRYNHKTKEQMPGLSYIGENKGAWFSPRHNIWVKVNTSNQISVHAATPRPHAISSPSGNNPVRGRSTTYTVRVTGDQEEPCPDETIEWELAGNGLLKKNRSRTNADGYASVDYFAPATGSLGNITLQAEIKF